MSYSASYTNENGITREVTITEDDSKEALKNDYQEIIRKYDPRYVTIQRIRATDGEALHIHITVNAPSHYLTSSDDCTPKPCSSMSADIICYPGYPLKSVEAYYDSNHYLASPNVFTSGRACIDAWIPFTSSLVTVVDKLVHDMIHDPNVTRYDSMANRRVEKWHKDGVAAGRFPTIPPRNLYVRDTPALPPRRTQNTSSATPPPLPERHH